MISLEIVDMSQDVPSPWGYRRMTIRCPHNFMGTAKASCGDLAGSLRLPRGSMIILGQNDNLKPCVVLTITVRCPYGDRTVSLRCVYGLGAYDFFKFVIVELNKIVAATIPVNLYNESQGLPVEAARKR